MSYGTPLTDTAQQGLRERRVVVEEIGQGTRRRTAVNFYGYPVALQDDAGVGGFLPVQVYLFPAALIEFHGASMNVQLSKQAVDGDAAGLADTWQGDAGLGSVVASSHSIATTKSDYIGTTTTDGATADSDAVAGVASVHGITAAISGATGGPRLIDATGGSTKVYFNLLVDDADQDATGHPVNVVLDGRVEWEWTIVGDKLGVE